MTRYVIVDVGCIECGEQTELVGIFTSKKAATDAFEAAANERGIEEWKPRGGFLEFLGLHGAERTTYVGGTGYFSGGQHSLELHVFPARGLTPESEAADA